MDDTKRNLVRMRGVHVSYGDVRALKGVDFDLARGEIHGLIGEHRAGKSTLVKLLSGAVTKEGGTIEYRGQQVHHFTPKTAIQSRIAIVNQTTTVIPTINAIENIFTGQRITSGMGFLNMAKMEARALRLFRHLNVDIDPFMVLERLSGAQQLMVEIAKAISIDPELLILDEVSSKLTPSEMDTIYRLLFEIKHAQGSVIYISHNMDEIFQFADRVTILRNGMCQGTEEIQELDRIKLIKMTYSFVLSRDELEQDHRELYLLKKYNESIIRNIPIGVIILDQGRRVSIINLAATKILRLRDEKILDQPIESVITPDRLERAQEIVEKIIQKVECKWEELHYADELLISLKAFPFRDEDYKSLGTILVIEDISKDRYIQDYLLRAEKISSVAELATGVAHEISNPLSVILNYVEILKRGHRNDRDLDRLTVIEKELNRIGDTIGSLLSFSRIRKIPKTSLDIVDLVREVVLLVDHKLKEKAVTLRWDNDGRQIAIYGDENSLKQVFVNLIINSVEAVEEHGCIEIHIQRIEPEGYVEIAILDDGCGIPPEIVDRIFDPFFTTKTGKKNTGLGLSICQHIIEYHDGLIICASGEKTAMKVRLPILAECDTMADRPNHP